MTALTFPEITATGPAVPEGRIRIGSEEHKRLFCKTLLDSFNPYRPAVIDWPALDAQTKARITALPIWDIAVQTENRAGLNVCTYAESVRDPLLRKAIELNGFEERRHRHVLANLVEAYGIKLAPEPVYEKPKDPEWAFMVTGYSECIDSFFAFGLFKAAKDTGYFPPELVETFDPVIKEEGRHILFFVNWVAWHRRNLPAWRRVFFAAKILSVWAYLIWERIGFARGIDGAGGGKAGTEPQDNNFVFTGSKAIGNGDVSAAAVIDVCMSEHEHRFSGYDPRLLRPAVMPRAMRFVRRFMRR
jgi:hypothetical protein